MALLGCWCIEFLISYKFKRRKVWKIYLCYFNQNRRLSRRFVRRSKRLIQLHLKMPDFYSPAAIIFTHCPSCRAFLLLLSYWLTRKRVYILLNIHFVCHYIFCYLVFYILLYFLCVFPYCIYKISSAPKMSIPILILQICMSVEYH